MIDEIDKDLSEWVQHTVSVAVDVSLALPPTTSQGQRVSLYLLTLSDMPPARGLKRAPTQFLLHYLVTTWAEQLEDAHRLLGQLAFAALENPDWRVDMEPLSADIWLALGVAPRPSFVLRVPVRRERPEPEVHYVRVPLEVQSAPIQHIHGVVLGPEDYPLASAQVQVIGGDLATSTDSKGHFRLAYVAGSNQPRTLRIVAKGRELEVAIAEPHSESEPLVIHFPESLFT